MRSRVLALVLALVVAGCGGEGSPERSPAASPVAAAPADKPHLGATFGDEDPDLAPVAGGKIVADSGFRADRDGFAFENYGESDGPELRAQEMRELFGDGVCVDPATDPCTLLPAAEEWRALVSSANAGGHCVGFSLLALQLRLGGIDVRQYGADTPYELVLADESGHVENDELAADIARMAAFRMVPDFRPSPQDYTPTQAVAKLRAAFAGGDDNYLLGFGFEGKGHAVVATKVVDRGEGVFDIVMYDNNYPYSPDDPERSDRRMRIDTRRDTWEYAISPLPDQAEWRWHGEPENPYDHVLGLWPGGAATLPQPCPFCTGGDGPLTVGLSGDAREHGHLAITDAEGRMTGYREGRLVNEIPGARVVEPWVNRSWLAAPEPVYHLPPGRGYEVELVDVPENAPAATLHAIGPGVGVGLSGLGAASAGTTVALRTGGRVAVAPRALEEDAVLRAAVGRGEQLRIDPGEGRFAVGRGGGGRVRVAGDVERVVSVDARTGERRELPAGG